MQVGSLIPQFFHDIIARLIPGFVLVATSYFVALGPSQSAKSASRFVAETGPSAGQLLFIAAMLVVASYVLAVLLLGLADALDLKKRLNNRMAPYPEAQEQRERGVIELAFPRIGDRLTKIRAERHMCEALLLGWLALVVGYPVLRHPWDWERFLVTESILVLLAYCAFLAQVMFRKAFIERLKMYYPLALAQSLRGSGEQPSDSQAS